MEAITGYVGQAEEVVVPRSINGTLVGMIWDGAFENKSALFYVELTKGVFYIGDAAFAGCISLEEVVLPERLEHIGERAFEGTSLTRVVVPDGMHFIARGTFPEDCNLTHADGMAVELVKCFDDVTGFPIVEIGLYPQSYSQQKGWDPEPIEWLVLEARRDGTALLMSRIGLDSRRYHRSRASVTWAECGLRAWLNAVFLKEAFSDEECERIIPQALANPDNPKYGTSGGADTEDSVFCLSFQEIKDVFGTKPNQVNSRLATGTTRWAVKEGADKDEYYMCYWWLLVATLTR